MVDQRPTVANDDYKKAEKFDFDYWDRELRLAISYRRTVSYITRWPRYEQYYRNRFGFNKLPYNIIYAMARTVVPHTYGTDPFINVSPINPEQALWSRLLETVDNTLINLNETELNNRTISLDTFLYGVGINQIGFLPVSESPEVLFADALVGGQKVIDTVYDTTKFAGMPWESRVKPRDFLVPFGCRLVKNARWTAVHKLAFTSDLVLDKRFKKNEIRPTMMPDGYDMSQLLISETEAANLFTSYYEIHCARTKKIYFMPGYNIAAGDTIAEPLGTKFVRDSEIDTTQIDGLPFASASFNEDPMYFWATPDATILEPYLNEMTEIRTQARAHRRSAMVKMFINEEHLKDGELQKLAADDPEALQFVLMQGGDDIRKTVMQLTPHIPHEILAVWINQVRQDVSEIYGASRNTMGQHEGGRKTATETGITFQNQTTRFDDKRRSLAKMMAATYKKKNAMAIKHWGQEQVMPVLGFDNTVYWMKFKPNEIKGQFTVRIDPESMSPVTKRAKKQEVMEMLQLLTGMAAQGAPINIMPVFQELIRQTSWMDVMQILPQGNQPNAPLGMDQFQKQQGQVLNTNNNRTNQPQGAGLTPAI